MFEIGFGELVLIFVVALLVFGPNKIPGLVRDVGYWVGRFRGFVSGVRGEVETELRKHDEWQRLIEEQADIVKRNVSDAVEDTRRVAVDATVKTPSTEVPPMPEAIPPPETPTTPAIATHESAKK